MNDQELIKMWKSQETKLNEVLMINRKLVNKLTRQRLDKTIGKLRRPKYIMLVIGLIYTLVIYIIAAIAFEAEGIFQFVGFGAIAFIMTLMLASYIYHLYLVNQISGEEEINKVQMRLAKLKISSYNSARLAVLQLPFWVICWMSMDALALEPVFYGGIHLILFALFTYLAYWLHRELSPGKPQSRVSRFFLSGSEWEPLVKSNDIIEQLKSME